MDHRPAAVTNHATRWRMRHLPGLHAQRACTLAMGTGYDRRQRSCRRHLNFTGFITNTTYLVSDLTCTSFSMF